MHLLKETNNVRSVASQPKERSCPSSSMFQLNRNCAISTQNTFQMMIIPRKTIAKMITMIMTIMIKPLKLNVLTDKDKLEDLFQKKKHSS